MAAYYNESDPRTAAWLRELVRRGLVADGEVDDRDIRDVDAADLAGFRHCHFFAGIGGWAEALRLAGWPDDRPVWTGSPPCQPFSVAGRGDGAADDRHLWPVYARLIAEHRPAAIFGEQVARAIRMGWLDAVLADLEALGYACAPAVLPACAVGAPHRRERLFFVAHADCLRRDGRTPHERRPARTGDGGGPERMGDAEAARLQERERQRGAPAAGGSAPAGEGPEQAGALRIRRGRVDNPGRVGCEVGGEPEHDPEQRARGPVVDGSGAGRWWDGAVWIPCGDGKARPIEPGTLPLADGVPARVVRISGFGNAIVPELGAQFVMAVEEAS